MKAMPFENMGEGARRELSLHDSRVDLHGDFELPIPCVKMRRMMIIPKHGDDDSKKPADGRQVVPLTLVGNITMQTALP